MGHVTGAPNPGMRMAAGVALFRADVSDGPAIQDSIRHGTVEVIAPGFLAYPTDAGTFVLQRIATATVNSVKYYLAVVYFPGSARDQLSALAPLLDILDVDLVKKANGTRAAWPVVQHADGTLRVPALDSDGSAIATAVKANLWPAAWVEPGGARYLGAVLAG